MKVFAIFLCVAVGHVFGERETSEDGAKKLRVNKDVMKDTGVTVYGDRRRIINDKNLEGRYPTTNSFDLIHPSKDKDVNSVVRKTSRNLSSKASTHKPRSSIAINNDTETTSFLRKVDRHLRALQRLFTTRSKTERKTLVDFPGGFIHDGKGKGRLRRRKRQADDPEDKVMSYRAYNKIRKKLPLAMRLKIRETTLAEDYLLDFYAQAGTSDEWRLKEYNRTRIDELEEFKRELDVAVGPGRQELIDNYKALRKGVPWNYDKLRDKYKTFFSKPSPGRTEYEAMKAKEFSLIDSVISGTNLSEIAAAGPKRSAEKAEDEAEREVRAKELYDRVELGIGEDAGNVVDTTDDAKVEVTSSVTGTPTTHSRTRSILITVAVLFALVMQAIIAFLILGPEMGNLTDWCRRRKTEEDNLVVEEKELLLTRKPYVQSGRTWEYKRLPSTTT